VMTKRPQNIIKTRSESLCTHHKKYFHCKKIASFLDGNRFLYLISLNEVEKTDINWNLKIKLAQQILGKKTKQIVLYDKYNFTFR